MSTVFEAVTRSRLRAVLAGVALGVVVLGLSIPLTAFALGGSSTPVRLVDADHVGAQAFSNVLFTTPLDVAAGLGDAPVGGTAGGNLEAAHGGARGSGRCSAAVLAAFFEQRENSLRASAWGEALDLDADAVGAHLAILTPAVLLRDTWAVAHTFESGSARPYDAVLRAGTDVLVDLRGVPRVRCADASPLLATRAVDDAEVIGTPWSGFDLADVTAITSGAPVERFVLVDVATGERFERPVGGDGTTDADHVPVPDGDATGTSDDEDALGRPTSTGSSPTVVPSSVVVPDVAGLDRDDALEVLADASLDVEVVERPDVSATTGAGVVLGTEPGAGAELPEGTPVLLVVSSGPVGGGPTSTVLPPPTVTPPTAPPTSRPTTTVAPPTTPPTAPSTTTTTAPSTTTTTAPTTTTTAPTTTTTTTPAQGLVPVPAVVGLSPAAAGSTLASQGLGVNEVGLPGGNGGPTVVDQSPSPGRPVPAGTTVVVVVRGGD